VVSVASRPLTRHASDELYGIALSAGLDADATLLTGCQPDDLVDADLYRRLASDLRSNRKLVIADPTGPPLIATLQGRVELLKLSEEELIRDRHARTGSVHDLIAGAQALHAAGVTHLKRGALAWREVGGGRPPPSPGPAPVCGAARATLS
jgi:1-phosphofructokinase